MSQALGLDVLSIGAQLSGGALAPAITVGQQFGNVLMQVSKQFVPEHP